MHSYYYTLFVLFAVVLYMISVDKNVEEYIVLLSKIIRINIERFFWMIRLHPFWITNPIGKWMAMRRYMRTAKELSREMGLDKD